MLERLGIIAKKQSDHLIEKQAQVKKSILEAKDNADVINKHKNFTKIEVTRRYKKVETRIKTLVCTNCPPEKANCHKNCRKPEEKKMECYVFDKSTGKCKLCPNSCKADQHVLVNYRYVPYDEPVTVDVEEIKA